MAMYKPSRTRRTLGSPFTSHRIESYHDLSSNQSILPIKILNHCIVGGMHETDYRRKRRARK